MKDLYSIGEVAKIMGISIQTLRYYSSIDLLKPAYINPSTGYRYYSYDQFHLIDRIKYLQKFGLSLEEISKILASNDTKTLLENLEQRKTECQKEISRLNDVIDSIEWYKQYFTYVDDQNVSSNGYSLHLGKRYLVAAKVKDGEPKEDFPVRLNQIKNSEQFRNLQYMRQFSCILDYDSLLENKLKYHYLGMFIKEAPSFTSESILEIPEGDYFCFKARILSEGWNPYSVKLFFADKPKPTLVLANEYENSLYEYSRCVYEVQILIPQTTA